MKKIFLLLTSLIIILAVLLSIWKKDNVATENALLIRQNNREYVLTKAELKKLSTHNFRTKRDDEFSGYLLSEVLKKYQFDELILSSADGGSLKLDKKDIPEAYLIEMDEESSYRLIIASDTFGQRWLKYVTKIELK